ncbi:MAG TPA: hypothetical protein VMV05_01070 [bacterium]|nr:hypothetical protein [bacterium]
MEKSGAGSIPLNLYIGTPCYGGQVTTEYFNSLLGLQDACANAGVNLNVLALWGEALITRARQNIVACFLEDPSATHLLFIDADIGFEPAQVFRLLAVNQDVTAALYPAKTIDWEKVKSGAARGEANLESAGLSYVTEWKPQYETINGFAKVAQAGTGFLLVKRGVFLAMMERYPQLRYSGGGPDDPLRNSRFRYAFFNCLLEGNGGKYLPEDYSFCKLWTDMGGEIWADFQSRLNHVGTMVYRGNGPMTFKPQSSEGGKA